MVLPWAKNLENMEVKMKKKYLPVGIDPGRDVCGVSILHPNCDDVISTFKIKNVSFPHAEKLIEESVRIAYEHGVEEPIFVLEATNVFWRPLFSYLTRRGFPCHTVCAKQTKYSRGTRMRKTKTDEIDAVHIAKLFKAGESHPTRFPPEPIMNLRELTRTYTFLTDMRVMSLNRIGVILFETFPEFCRIFSTPFIRTALNLMKKRMVHPGNLKEASIEELALTLSKTSKGKLGREKAEELIQGAMSTFGIPEAHKAFSQALSSFATLAEDIERTLKSLEEIISEELEKVPQKLLTIPGMGPVSVASFIGELGEPSQFQSINQVVAWFGLDPAIKQSGSNEGTGKHISKAGTKYGRRTMWLAARSFVRSFDKAGKKYQRLLEKRHWIDALTIIAADLVKICYAMYRDGTVFDKSKYR